jgi:hypothetical protein
MIINKHYNYDIKDYSDNYDILSVKEPLNKRLLADIKLKTKKVITFDIFKEYNGEAILYSYS